MMNRMLLKLHGSKNRFWKRRPLSVAKRGNCRRAFKVLLLNCRKIRNRRLLLSIWLSNLLSRASNRSRRLRRNLGLKWLVWVMWRVQNNYRREDLQIAKVWVKWDKHSLILRRNTWRLIVGSKGSIRSLRVLLVIIRRRLKRIPLCSSCWVMLIPTRVIKLSRYWNHIQEIRPQRPLCRIYSEAVFRATQQAFRKSSKSSRALCTHATLVNLRIPLNNLSQWSTV